MEKAGSLRVRPDGRGGPRFPTAITCSSEEDVDDVDGDGGRRRAATAGAAGMPGFKGPAMRPPQKLIYQRSHSLSEGKSPDTSPDEGEKAFSTSGPRRCVSVVSPFHGGDGGGGRDGGWDGGDKKDLERRNDKITEE